MTSTTDTDLKDMVKPGVTLAFLTPDKNNSKGRLLENETTTVTKASTTAQKASSSEGDEIDSIAFAEESEDTLKQ